MDEIKSKDMTTGYLDRIGIVARIGIEDGEFTRDEILEYIGAYGNKKIEGTLNMGRAEFAVMAMMEALKTGIGMMKEGEEK